MRTALVRDSLAAAWKTLRPGFRGIFVPMLKVGVAAFAIAIAGLALAGVAGILLWGVSPIGAVAVAAVFALAGLFFASVASSLNYNIVDSIAGRRKLAYGTRFRRNMLPMLLYDALTTAVFLAVAAPFVLLIFAAYYSGAYATTSGELVSRLILRIGMGGAIAVVWLFIQFAIFELLVAEAGVLESFRRSIALVRRNLLETAAFSTIVWAASGAIALPFAIIFLIAILLLLAAIGLGASAGAAFLLIAIAVIVVMGMAIALIESALQSTLTVVAGYRFWLGARKSK